MGKQGGFQRGPLLSHASLSVIFQREHTLFFFENVSLCFLCVYRNWIKDLKMVLEAIVNCLKIVSII